MKSQKILIFEKKFILKSNYLLILSVLYSLNFFSQDSDSEEKLISRFRPGVMWFYTGLKPATPEKVRKYDRLIVDLVYNDWLSKEIKPFKNKATSIGFNTHLMFDLPITKGNTISFGTGISYGLYRVHTNGYFVRSELFQKTEFFNDASLYGVEKSVFKLNTLSVPFELRFRGKNWKHAKFHVGARVSYQFHGSTTLSSTNEKIESQQKTIGFYDLNPINVSSHIRFGIRNWSLYASYGFLPLFKSSESVQLNPFQFGVSLSLF